MEPASFPMMITTPFVNAINSFLWKERFHSAVPSEAPNTVDLWLVVLATLWRGGNCTTEGLPHSLLHRRRIAQRQCPSPFFLSPCTIQTGLPGAVWLTGLHLKLLLPLIRFSQERHFLCVLSWLYLVVPQHSWEWCPWHIWGGERSVSSEGALTSLHVTVGLLSPHVQITAQSLLEFLLVVSFPRLFLKSVHLGRIKSYF